MISLLIVLIDWQCSGLKILSLDPCDLSRFRTKQLMIKVSPVNFIIFMLFYQGTLKGFDQTVNIILDESHERVFSSGSGVEQVLLGLYIIRGDNM